VQHRWWEGDGFFYHAVISNDRMLNKGCVFSAGWYQLVPGIWCKLKPEGMEKKAKTPWIIQLLFPSFGVMPFLQVIFF